jgi:Oxidoreductase FAD-binding domain
MAVVVRLQGYFDLVIKRYPEGNVSNFMHKLQPGDTVTVKGPFLKVSACTHSIVQVLEHLFCSNVPQGCSTTSCVYGCMSVACVERDIAQG